MTDLLGDTDTRVTSCEADAVDSWVLGQEVSDLRALAWTANPDLSSMHYATYYMCFNSRINDASKFICLYRSVCLRKSPTSDPLHGQQKLA